MLEIPIPTQVLVNVEDLTTDGDNPNKMTDRQLKQLQRSIQQYGFIVPIITNKDLLIADGEQRWTVAHMLGMRQVPVIRLDVEDVDRRLLRQVLNKLKGEHEELKDAYEFQKILEAGSEEDLKTLLAVSDSQVERLLQLIKEPKPEDYEIPEIEKIKTDIERGDIYLLGDHRLMCGDATSREDVEKLMDGEKADMVFTDPPYGIKYVPKSGKIGGDHLAKVKTYNPIQGDNIEFNPSHLINLASKIILFGGNYYANKLPNSPVWLVWNKKGERRWDKYPRFELLWTNLKHKAKIYHCLWAGMIREGESDSKIHPTQKPIKLLSEIIQDVTAIPNIILDPYGGSGSTLIACQQTGRICYMMEIDPRYCQVIINRWEKYTGLKATRYEVLREND